MYKLFALLVVAFAAVSAFPQEAKESLKGAEQFYYGGLYGAYPAYGAYSAYGAYPYAYYG